MSVASQKGGGQGEGEISDREASLGYARNKIAAMYCYRAAFGDV